MPSIGHDGEEFERLIEALGQDLSFAAAHFRLFKDLRAAARDHAREFREAETFWWLTLNAHLQVALHALSRVYDQKDSALSLGVWLGIIKENLHLFAEENFRERLRDNPFVASLSAQARSPDPEQLARDSVLCSTENPFVQRLVRVRNNALSHRGAKLAAKGRSVFNDVDLSHDVLDKLIKTGFEIYNHYNQLFRAASLSSQMLGHDDFQHVLAAVRADLARREKEIDEEIFRDASQ